MQTHAQACVRWLKYTTSGFTPGVLVLSTLPMPGRSIPRGTLITESLAYSGSDRPYVKDVWGQLLILDVNGWLGY